MSKESEERQAREQAKEEARQAKEQAKEEARQAKEQQLKEEARQAKEAAEKAKQDAIKSLENSVLGPVVGGFGKSRNESEQKAFDQNEKGKTTNRAAHCILAVILLAVIGSCFGGGKDKTQTPKQETAQTQQINQEPPKAQTGDGNQDPIMKILNGEPTEQEKLDQEKAIRAEEERKAKEKQAEKQAEGYVRTWCGRMRLLMTDTDEQWTYWWPIATGSGDILTDYDADNTLNLNLKQYLKNLDGGNYNIPNNAAESQKNQMKEIEKKFRDSLWKRILASEKYANALRTGKFDNNEALGIRRRANESDISAAAAWSLLNALEERMGMESGSDTSETEKTGNEEEDRVEFNLR